MADTFRSNQTLSRTSENGNIVLVGFMGAGKSTVGAELARLGGLRLIDLDHLIVSRQGCSIREIFRQDGEEAFRDYEALALERLAGLSRAVIATGGGIVGRPGNWLAMRRLGPVVYLRADWDTLCRRIGDDPDRPLADRRSGDEKLRRLWEKRVPLYEQADLVVDSTQGTPAQVAALILERLKQEGRYAG